MCEMSGKLIYLNTYIYKTFWYNSIMLGQANPRSAKGTKLFVCLYCIHLLNYLFKLCRSLVIHHLSKSGVLEKKKNK